MIKVGRTVSVTVVGAAVALLASGCGGGLGAEPPRSGVAVEVNGETLTLEELDTMVEEFCTVWEDYEQAQPVAKSTVRISIVEDWAYAAGAEEVYAEAGIEPRALNESDVEGFWSQVGGELDDDNREPLTEWARLRNLMGEPLVELGTESLAAEGGSQADPRAAQERGYEIFADWLAEQDVSVNPAIGTVENGRIVPESGGLSVPVSDLASVGSDPSRHDPDYLNSLPAAQRCGPEAAAQPTMPGLG